MRGVWVVYHGGTVARCPQCGKGFSAVYDAAELMVRVKPAIPDGVRAHLSRKCDRCKATLDVVVVDTQTRSAA